MFQTYVTSLSTTPNVCYKCSPRLSVSSSCCWWCSGGVGPCGGGWYGCGESFKRHGIWAGGMCGTEQAHVPGAVSGCRPRAGRPCASLTAFHYWKLKIYCRYKQDRQNMENFYFLSICLNSSVGRELTWNIFIFCRAKVDGKISVFLSV